MTGAGHGVRGEAGVGGIGVKGVGATGMYAQSTNNANAYEAFGNAKQNRTAGGWVKAMAYIDPDRTAGQQVVRCFNSQVAPDKPSCGMTVISRGIGSWEIGFGFDVSDRFPLVTPDGIHGAFVATACCAQVNTVLVGLARNDNAQHQNVPFWIVIF